MEKTIEKTLQELIEAQEKNHKALGVNIHKMKTEFDAKFQFIAEWVSKMEEKMLSIDLELQNKKENIKDHNIRIIN